MPKVITALLTGAAFLSSIAAYAVDGVTLIDQAMVSASGGFPLQIKEPGSYRLSGNLVVTSGPNSIPDAIHILSDRVTLDLNGFSITAPGAPANSAITDAGTSHEGIAIRNGTINGWTTAISLADCKNCTVQQMILYGNRNGILIGPVAMVGANVVEQQVVPLGFSVGIQTGINSTITGNTISGFSDDMASKCPSLLVGNLMADGWGGLSACTLYSNLPN